MIVTNQTSLGSLIRAQGARYGLAIAMTGLATAALFSVPLVAKYALDSLLGERTFIIPPLLARWLGEGAAAGLVLAAIAIVALTAVAGVASYSRDRLAATAAQRVIRRLRERLYRHLHRLPMAAFDRADSGDWVQRCSSDIETLRQCLARQVVEMGRVAILLLFAVPLLFWLDAELAWVSTPLLPVVLGFALLFHRRVATAFRHSDEAEGAMTAVLQENLVGIRVVRAFAREEYEIDRFARYNAAYRDTRRRMIELLAIYWSVGDALCLGQIGLTLLVGATMVQEGAITVGTLYAFLGYLALVVFPVRQLGRVVTEVGMALVALKRIGELLDAPAEPEPAPVAVTLAGGIEFDNVTFAYDDGTVALRRFSLTVAPGETVALIGPPGAGKSTVVQLLLRLYDGYSGEIRLDGRPLATLPREALRRQLGVVLQEPFLYSRTVTANLHIGRADAQPDQLHEATTAACIHDDVQRLSGGYETIIGERGVNLSGGQRQRLALARALLRKPPILLLDDALSAVDSRTEGAILAALEQRRGRQTTLVIAHRLSTVAHADRIALLEQGQVIQLGTHQALIQRPGPYARLWSLQSDLEAAIARDTGQVEARRSGGIMG